MTTESLSNKTLYDKCIFRAKELKINFSKQNQVMKTLTVKQSQIYLLLIC